MRWRWKVAQAAEIRWWQYYLKNRPKEEYLSNKKEYWRRILNELALQIEPDSSILDAGCGPAGIFILLDQYEVDAVDPLLDQYEAQLTHFSRANYPNVRFFDLPLEQFESEKKYDVIFCLNAINHVDDLDRSLHTLVRSTKAGGQLFISTDAHNYSFFKRLFRLIPGDILHPHQYDIGEYCALIEAKGCVIQEVKKLKQHFFFDYYIIHAKANL